MSKDLIIAVTGSPGTGKTAFSKNLAEALNCELLDLNEFIESQDIFELDPEGTKLVNPEDLERSFKIFLDKLNDDLVVDGLLSHLLPSDFITHVVVLRTDPRVLKNRLKQRDYPEKKLRDNIEAEALGVILSESVDRHGIENVYEIDTTEDSPEKSLEIFKKALKGDKSLKPGSVDWLDFFLKENDHL